MKFGPNTITDGLVLALDAANPRSYPGSGTVWKDLSGGSDNGTLVNGPTFNSNGYLVFDGTNDYISVPTVLDVVPNSISIFIWVNINTAGDNGLCSKNNISGEDRFYFFANTDGSLSFHYEENNNGYTQINTPSELIPVDEWIYTGFTWDSSNGVRLWVNGVNVYTSGGSTSLPRNGTFTDFWIGAAGSSSPARFFDGEIASVKYYNKALTSDEVLQNYNSTKQRFK